MLVVGMHRSGTSAVTRAVTSLGLDPGTDPLLGATADNPTGHFEVERLTAVDDELLDTLGGRWAAPPDAPADDVAALAGTELGERAATLAGEVFTGPDWVWKDPRLTLLLPFWRAVLSPEPTAIVVLRHPLEVARSLHARDGMALDYGLALWERYTRVALRDLQGMTAFVIDYGRAVADPERAVADLARFLSDCGVTVRTGEAAGIEGFVGGHRRQRADDDELATEPTVTDEVRDLHHLAHGLLGAHDPFPELDLGAETPGLQRAFREHKRLSRHEEQAPILRSEIALRDSRIDDLRAEIDRRSEQAGHLADEVLALREAREALDGRVARLTEELAALEAWGPVRVARGAQRLRRRLGRRGAR